MTNNKKTVKQVRSKDQQKQIVQSKKKPARMNYGMVQYKEGKDKYAQSVLMPEATQGGRIPTRFAVPTATIQHYEKFDIKTNDQGQAIVCMYPNDMGRLATLDNPDGNKVSDFALWKGGQVKAQIATNVISKYRVVSAVMRYHFTQNALKQQGSRTIALVPGNGIFHSVDGLKGVNHAVLEKCMYHETNDVQKSARMIWLPMDPADSILMSTESGSLRDAAYVALMLTGCAESEHIGYIEVTVNLEYVPRLEYWNTVVRELVPSDSTVQDRVESVVSSNPSLSHQPLSQLQKLWTQIKPHLISSVVSVARSALSA